MKSYLATVIVLVAVFSTVRAQVSNIEKNLHWDSHCTVMHDLPININAKKLR